MKTAIVGGGIAGLSAAYDLLAAGHSVTIFEAGSRTGGLAAGFKDDRWQWPLEKFYHHLFTSDKDIIRLVEEIGIKDRLFFPRPVTSVIYDGQVEPFDSPRAWITFPGFNLFDIGRFGLVGAYLRFTKPWRTLEKTTADDWLRRWYGDKIYESVWRPLLIGKFGPYYQLANMAWMWARLKVRSPRLGYFVGGFQSFVDALTAAVVERGCKIQLNSPVRSIAPAEDSSMVLATESEEFTADSCLVTTSPSLLSAMVKALPERYHEQLRRLKHMGAAVVIAALRQQLLPKTYWLNLPASSPDKTQNEFPFLALVEHTNYIDPGHYGGDHLVYCGDYLAPDHPYFDMAAAELESLFLSVLPRFNPGFSQDWVRKTWLFRTRYAQPVPEINHSKRIPEIRTPLPNLYFASMSQVYPWDRGTNYAVEIGRRAAKLMLASERDQEKPTTQAR